MAIGLTQRQVGVLAGIDASIASTRVNQYERQKHQPAFAVVKKLAQVLRRPPAYFYASDDNLAELITLYGQLRGRSRDRALAAVKRLAAD